MFKSYKNAFYSKFLDIYTSIIYKDKEVRKGEEEWGEEGKKEDITKRLAIYNKFIDLYALYYKNEEFIISVNMDNEELLSWKHEKMPININVMNKQIKCPKYPLYNL